MLGSTPAIRFYLNADASAYTFKIGNGAVESEDITTGSDSVGNYVDISVYAYRMIENITIEKGTDTATYHINHYYGSMAESERDIVIKFYSYCKSAAAYKAAVTAK